MNIMVGSDAFPIAIVPFYGTFVSFQGCISSEFRKVVSICCFQWNLPGPSILGCQIGFLGVFMFSPNGAIFLFCLYIIFFNGTETTN